MASEIKSKLKKNAAVITALSLMLGITTLALILSFGEVKENRFITGTVDIELNGGKPIFDGSDNNIEPNYTIVKEFTIENKGTADVYYRLYVDQVSGPLQEVLNFKIYEGDQLLFNGPVSTLTKEHPCTSEKILAAGETRVLRQEVNMSKDSDNRYIDEMMQFDMTADAVQVKNNPKKEFN